MRTAALAALTSVVGLSVCSANQHSTFRIHREASANDGPAFSTQIRLFGRLVTIEKVPTISERDVTGFQSYRAPDGTYGGLFRLNAHGRLVLDSLSVERRGSFLFVFINGRPITELQVDQRIPDGKIYIASGLNSNEIELMKKDWPPSAAK
jgi:hypothetical protein